MHPSLLPCDRKNLSLTYTINLNHPETFGSRMLRKLVLPQELRLVPSEAREPGKDGR